MMREAQKMMQDPSFQAHMQQLMQGQPMQQALQQTKETMADPKKLHEFEEKAKRAIADGEKELQELEMEKASKGKEQRVEDSSNEDHNEKTSVSNKSAGTAIAVTTSVNAPNNHTHNNVDDDDAVLLENIPDIPALNLN
jgi:hypothetical protein